MKRKCILSLLLIISIMFMGCVSDSDYKALEQRVSYLEQQLGVSTGNESGTNPDVAITSNSDNANKEPDKSEEPFSYYIDNLSDDQVVAECKYYFENIPSQGESFDSYYSKLKATPVSASTDYGVGAKFYGSNIYEVTSHDAITEISIAGSQTEMDGTIGYSTNYYGVQIKMIIQDYNRAANIYDQLYNIIVDENYRDIDDRRDSTNWQAYGIIYHDGSWGFDVPFMNMDKRENGYHIEAIYYRWR